VPKVSFPGGALIGCSAGFVNVPRIKGSHNAVLSGMLAAEQVAEALAAGKAMTTRSTPTKTAWRGSEIGKDLKRCATSSRSGRASARRSGVGIGGIDMWINQLTGGWSPLGTLKHGKPDYAATDKAANFKPIAYPKPDGVLTFDRLSSVFLSNTNHEEDQPVHLKVKDEDLQKSSEYAEFAGPVRRYCPAGVYEWIDADGNSVPADADRKPGDSVRFQINAQNCVHCKTCDIKDPEPEHQLDGAAGRRGTGLSEHVSPQAEGTCPHIPACAPVSASGAGA
jgi:electron-transferring-flavoprotein dehydrogenase